MKAAHQLKLSPSEVTANDMAVIKGLTNGSAEVSLPLKRFFTGMLQSLESNQPVTFPQDTDLLTTQEAADYLCVSRPFLIGLLEKGEIPFHLVGTHRRVSFKDLSAYRMERSKIRREGLREMTRSDIQEGVFDLVDSDHYHDAEPKSSR